jgi:hypothetical protein
MPKLYATPTPAPGAPAVPPPAWRPGPLLMMMSCTRGPFSSFTRNRSHVNCLRTCTVSRVRCRRRRPRRQASQGVVKHAHARRAALAMQPPPPKGSAGRQLLTPLGFRRRTSAHGTSLSRYRDSHRRLLSSAFLFPVAPPSPSLFAAAPTTTVRLRPPPRQSCVRAQKLTHGRAWWVAPDLAPKTLTPCPCRCSLHGIREGRRCVEVYC